MTTNQNDLSGEILLGVSETDTIRFIGQCASQLIKLHPKVTLKLRNGDNESVLNMVNSGLAI